ELERGDPDAEDEDRGDHRGDAGEDVDHERGGLGELGVRVLDQHDAGGHTEWDRDDGRDDRLDEAAVDRVTDAPGHGGRGDQEERVGPPRGVEDRGEAVDDHLEQERDQRDQREDKARGEHHQGDLVPGLAAPGDRQEGLRRLGGLGEVGSCLGHQPLTFPPDTERAMRLTTNVRLNSTSPEAMWAPVGSGWLNSAEAEAILDANVKPPSNSDRTLGSTAARRMMRTATVSPSARPRASMAPATIPDLA